jgi:hypothetical protein
MISSALATWPKKLSMFASVVSCSGWL